MYVRNNYYHRWMYNDNIDCKRKKKYNPISLLCCLHAILIQSNGRLMDIFNILDAFGGIQSNTMKQSL